MNRILVTAVAALAAILLAMLVAGCAGTVQPAAQRIATRDVLISVREPCPAEEAIPPVPLTVHEEHPTMPQAADKAAIDQLLGASAARERILAGKILEYRTYSEKADAILRRCARPDPAPAATPAN